MTMTIEVKLFATLRKYLPPGGNGKSTHLELKPDATVTDLLKALKIPAAEAQLILINGRHTRDRDKVLEGDCAVSIFPAMAGGER